MGTTRRTDEPKRTFFLGAQVAELVDAQVSGTCGRKVVEVRVFSWAPSSRANSSRERAA